ncbi:MAG: hypothetical protein LAT55_00155 [Opitutales bacterium]|nr:hypothetical protein [Opitutales bacterium]
MAWRISEQVISGEIDNRTKGRVTGFLELANGSGRIVLDLEGNAHPDLAGSLIRFTNPRAQPGPLEEFPPEQRGLAGDMTASHRVKDLLVPVETFLKMDEEARSKAYRWANCLYLEWYRHLNGRVVIEGIGYEVEWVEGPLWQITEEDLREQAERGQKGLADFFGNATAALEKEAILQSDDDREEVPPEEAAMDAEAARMDLLNDRIGHRMEKEGTDDWKRIYEEESARLRRERGEPEPLPPTPEEEATQREWIEEVNAAGQEALEEGAAESWKEEQSKDHPLVTECREFAVELREEGFLPEGMSVEHPLWEIADGVLFASGKLAGALNGCMRDGEWPPHELMAPSVLVFLKKARRYLRDALRGLDSADEEKLVTPEWRATTRARLTRLLLSTQQHILEARQSLQ